MKAFFLFILFISSLLAIAQPNCSANSSGVTPINDLGAGTFNGWTGGLYPNGSNYLPLTHRNAGLQMASQIQCLDTNGNPDAVNGKIVWLSIGMSNCTMETQQFITQANGFAGKNPKLTLVDGAQGGQTAQIISCPWNANYANFWNTVITRLKNAGVSAKQVQVIWYKEANQANAQPIQTYYDSLVVQIKRSMNELKTRFPNVKLCYLASRISGRYASSALNPEPYAYWTGWAVKKAIEDQINGDVQLAYSGNNAKAPWMSWGIYMWSDGSTPQTTDTTIYVRCPTDLQNDGTHPSIPTGAARVATWLLKFFSTDSISEPWFWGTGCPAATGIAHNEMESEIFIFPNPSKGMFKIQDTKFNIQNLELYNIMGDIIYTMSPSPRGLEGGLTIDLSNQPAGIYFLKLKSESRSYFRKLVVSN